MFASSSQVPPRFLFLPGASGNRQLWREAAEPFQARAECHFFGWPGFADTPANPNVRGTDDLVRLVLDALRPGTHLFAQSMGGVVAVLAALARPEWVASITLAVTSGGLDLAQLGATDWRSRAHEWMAPNAPTWFLDEHRDLSARLPELQMPALLLWADRDALSPVAVGQALARLLPNAQLLVFPDSDHDVVKTHAPAVAEALGRHLTPFLR